VINPVFDKVAEDSILWIAAASNSHIPDKNEKEESDD
jgi:hypothetical protein